VTAPPDDAPPPPLDNSPPLFQTTEPLGPTDDNSASPPHDQLPHENAPTDFEHPSTVPEPGSLALTATGIIGLIPLVRRRRR
jgi:hypothetical protein